MSLDHHGWNATEVCGLSPRINKQGGVDRMIPEERAPTEREVGTEVGFFQGLLIALLVGGVFWAVFVAIVLH
jgi:hypothetical protein